MGNRFMGNGLWVMGYGLWVMGYGLPGKLSNAIPMSFPLREKRISRLYKSIKQPTVSPRVHLIP